MDIANTRLWRVLPRIAALALVACALSGCIVVSPYHYPPAYGYYR
jgi:hypothetical protein